MICNIMHGIPSNEWRITKYHTLKRNEYLPVFSLEDPSVILCL